MKASHPRIVPHAFSPALIREVLTYGKLDNWHGPLELFEQWTVILLAVVGSRVAMQTLPIPWALSCLLLSLFVIGGRQRALAGVLHQAVHGSFMADRMLGRVLVMILGGHPVLQSFSGYSASHVRNHHGHFGEPGMDPDYQFFLDACLYESTCGRKTFRRYLIGIASPSTSLRYLEFLLRHRILNPYEEKSEAILRIALYSVLIAASIYWNVLSSVFLYWLLPLVTTQVWIGSYAELVEHYPLMQGVPATDILMSRNRDFGSVWRLVLGEKRGEGYHLVHHLFPRIPIWNLHKVHEILLADPAYARLDMPRSPLQSLRIIEGSLPPKREATVPQSVTSSEERSTKK